MAKEQGEQGPACLVWLEVTYLSLKEQEARPNTVSQDLGEPSQNTRTARRQRLLKAGEENNSCPAVSKAANRQSPLQFLVDLAAAVLDEETSKLLEYRHLIKRPKHKKAWGYSFGNEIGRLAQGMPGRNTSANTIYFVHKSEIPNDRWKYVTSGRTVCKVRPQKRKFFERD